MGAPGSGKGTYAEGIKVHFSIPHISTGEIFRKAMQEETPMGLIAKSFIDKGQLAPDDITNKIVKERIQQADCKEGFLLDGYPRTIEQAIEFDKILQELNIKLNVVVNLLIDEDIIVSRIVNRRMCSSCGKGYNVVTIKPKVEGVCDICGAPLFQRDDDHEETVISRLKVYNTQTKPLVEYYKNQNLLLNVDGSGEISVVTKRIIDAMEEF
jgi:adenylate kinase